jgi:hypothetical protein
MIVGTTVVVGLVVLLNSREVISDMHYTED